MKFEALHGVAYFADDLAASTVWWSAVFGLSPRLATETLVIFEVGGTEVVLHPRDGKSSEKDGSQVAYWRVVSIAETAAVLTAMGGMIYRQALQNADGSQVCQVVSPDGTVIGLYQAAGTGNTSENEV